MKCPVCKEPNLVISERKGIEIDYCPDCRGIWLDRGELDKILDRSREEEQSEQRAVPAPAQPQQNPYQQQPPPPQYGHHPHSHPHYYKKRKKSFLEELFD